MFKVKPGIAPLFMADIFEERLIPNEGVVSGLRSQSYFYNYNNPRTVFYGTETLRHLGAKIWNILPVKIKTSNNLNMFKANIKTWVPINCPCRLCIPYEPGRGTVYTL